MNAEGMTLLAGGIALTGSTKSEGGFPSNGYPIIAGTLTLAFLYSLANRSNLEKPVKALAALTLLASVFYYVPILTGNTTKKKKKKEKNNG